MVIPDDAAELAAEAESLRAELSAPPRRRALRRIRRLRAPDRGAGLFFGACIALIALLAAAAPMIWHTPRSTPHLTPRSLAAPEVGDGAPGGLMPAITVAIRGREIPLRDLRPAVVIVVEAGCDCIPAVRNAVTSARSRLASVYIADGLQSPTSTPQAQLIADQVGYAEAFDAPNALLWQYFGGPGAHAVFVSAEGVIAGQSLPLSEHTHIEPWLDRLNT